MIVIIGLVVLIVTATLAVVGVETNNDSVHSLNGNFALFGQHMGGLSTGRLYLYGIIVGIGIALGLNILRVAFSRGRASKGLQRDLKKSQEEITTLRLDQTRLTQQLDEARTARSQADTANTLETQNPPSLA